MYLRINKRKDGRTHLSIVRGYRDKNGKSKAKTIQTIGYLDVLENKLVDPISHFKKVVDDMNIENQEVKISIPKDAKIDINLPRKNFGYSALKKIYKELEIDEFLITAFKHKDISEYKINNILMLLVFARALFPNSKKATFELKDKFFENFNFSLKDIYRSLTHIEPFKCQLQKFIYDNIKKQYSTNTDCVYYDVTNYYFEIDENDDLRKKGVSKEHRPNPIVQMGLFMDSFGLPMSYKLFQGNTNDCLTLGPMIKDLKFNYNIDKVIVVADKGLNTSNNIALNIIAGNGYLMSQSIRGADKNLKDFVLDGSEYINNKDGFKIKSRLYPRTINVTTKNGKKKKVDIDEKQVIFYSPDYDKRAKAERQPAIDKANALIGNVSKYNKKNCHGASKYIKHLVFDNDTGEIIIAKSKLQIDLEKINEEEKFDGYYAIVTSEYKKTNEEIIDIYRGLWKIEETFKITKSDLEARPVFLSRKEHIEAHFLTCYLALVLSRILQHKLNNKYSVTKLLITLSNVNCSNIQENYYLFDYFDEVTEEIGKCLNIDYSRKILTLQDIKKNL